MAWNVFLTVMFDFGLLPVNFSVGHHNAFDVIEILYT